MGFYTVQRLEDASDRPMINPYGGDPSLSSQLVEAGAGVELDYMGAAEFEYGEPERSQERILATAGRLRIVTQHVVVSGSDEDVHFITSAAEQQTKAKLSEWQRWAERPRTAEPTGFFPGNDEDQIGPSDRTVAWWDLHEDLIWTRDPKVALRLLGAFAKLAAEK